jgi:hypothetical protein
MDSLENKVRRLEAEIIIMKRIIGVKMEKKDPKVWEKLQKLGKEISKSWKSDKPSWQIISESRR